MTKVTIVPRGQALGVTQSTPLDDRYNYSQDYLLARIQTALGGRAAEEVALGTITTGAENDLQLVTRHRPPDGGALGHEQPGLAWSPSASRSSPFLGLEAETRSARV